MIGVLLAAALVVPSLAVPTSFELPMHGNLSSFPVFWTQLHVGGRFYSVVFDTGSADLLVPSTLCKACPGKATTHWSPQASQTGGSVRVCPACGAHSKSSMCIATPFASQRVCAFDEKFAGMLAEQAVLADDAVQLWGGVKPVRAVFGAITNISAPVSLLRRRSASLLRADAGTFFFPDGLWGSAYAALGSTGAQLIDTVVDAYSPPLPNILSHCFGNESGGAITIGANSPYAAAALQFTPLTSKDFYRIHVNAMSIDGVQLAVQPSIFNKVAAIVDTGTPGVTVPHAVFEALKRQIALLCSRQQRPWRGLCDGTLLDGQCVEFTAAEIASLPTLSFQLGDPLAGAFTLDFTPQAYLRPAPYVCETDTALFFTVSAPGDGFTVLGAAFLAQYAVSIHRTAGKIGFAPMDKCPNM